MLAFVLWMIVGAIGQFALGVFHGMKISKIEDEYGLDEHTADHICNEAIIAAGMDVIPLSKLGLALMIKRSKMWIPVGIFNNLCGYFLWPILLPKMHINLNEAINELREHFDCMREKERS